MSKTVTLLALMGSTQITLTELDGALDDPAVINNLNETAVRAFRLALDYAGRPNDIDGAFTVQIGQGGTTADIDDVLNVMESTPDYITLSDAIDSLREVSPEANAKAAENAAVAGSMVSAALQRGLITPEALPAMTPAFYATFSANLARTYILDTPDGPVNAAFSTDVYAWQDINRKNPHTIPMDWTTGKPEGAWEDMTPDENLPFATSDARKKGFRR